MLFQLSIKNYVTVDRLDIDFRSGMTSITGETGAGKSIILGALGLAIGDRAERAVVRKGAEKTEIFAEFNTTKLDMAKKWMEIKDLAPDNSGTCILRRIVTSDGRSKGYINGIAVTMSNLRDLGEMLIDIHNQHEHQSLMQKSTHQRLLDEFCLENTLRDKLLFTWKQWHNNFKDMEELRQQSGENSAQTQLLNYQLSELKELDIKENEVEELEREFKKLNNADGIMSAVTQALSISQGDESNDVLALIQSASNALDEIPTKPDEISDVIKLLESAQIQIEESVSDLRSFREGFEADPERLNQINGRLSELHSVSRKHKINPNGLSMLIKDLELQLNRFEKPDEELTRLEASDKLLRKEYKVIAKRVSEKRTEGGNKLAKEINSQLLSLGMPHAKLEIHLTSKNDEEPNEGGQESVEFVVSTNPGQSAESLNKIASGGELSRISLAIQVSTAQTSQIPSLVFDEVDVGIGGGIAKLVGDLMRSLGEKTQILCVTHQAQVASQSHNHLFVSKVNRGNSASTQIEELSGESAVKEIARMLGGDNFSDESLAHAKQMTMSH
ncbi:DNA repair protein RecN [Gammaproteobacteria bacterium]|nr:DNA repair protein RecN [Gammaproteobacteria bacterium]